MFSLNRSQEGAFRGLRIVAGCLAFLILPRGPLMAESAATGPQMEAFIESEVQGKTMWGEPYEVRGNRMFFTDWFLIRPGSIDWLNSEGVRINEVEEGDDNPVYGPWSAQLSRPSSPFGIRIVAQPAKRVGPVIQREKPWERGYVIFKTVLKDGDIYRAWCKTLPGGDSYMESRDGYTWERPVLGQVEFEGSRENNLLKPGPSGTVFIDPQSPPGERYKAVGGTRVPFEEFKRFVEKYPDRWETRVLRGKWNEPERFYVTRGAVSPDGINWKSLPEPFTIEHSDGMETGYYDPFLKKYVVYTRTWLVGPRSDRWTGDRQARTWTGEHHGPGRRAIGRMESSTFGDFPVSTPVIVPVPGETLPSDSFYTSIHTSIPGAPDIHLMFPTVWDTRDDTSSLGLWSSHDGIVWNRLPGPPVLDTAAFGEWDGGCVFSFPSLFELPNGDFALPYKGYNLPHKYPRGDMELYAGYAVWPKGRIVAVEADEIGEFSTVAILPPGGTLKINALTERAGGIRVELARMNNDTIPGRSFEDCEPVQGDAFWQTVTWRGESDLMTPEGEGLVIRFRMDRAQLFGVEFE
jgi:hypothetical protein